MRQTIKNKGISLHFGSHMCFANLKVKVTKYRMLSDLNSAHIHYVKTSGYKTMQTRLVLLPDQVHCIIVKSMLLPLLSVSVGLSLICPLGLVTIVEFLAAFFNTPIVRHLCSTSISNRSGWTFSVMSYTSRTGPEEIFQKSTL